MPEIKYVTVQLGDNRIVEGFYTIEGDLLTMTYADGEPVVLFPDTEVARKVQQTIKPGEKPHYVAAYLTKEIRSTMMGDRVDGFSGPINYDNPSPKAPLNYPKLGVA